MESICRPPFLPNPLFSKPLKTLTLTLTPSKTLIPIRSRQNPNPAKTLISSVAKPTLVALTAVAAVLLSRHPKPSLAAAPSPPAAQSETLAADEHLEKALESRLSSNPNDIPSLRSLMELKIRSRRLPEAISIVDRLIDLDPEENDLLILRAHLQSYGGDHASARAGFEALLAKDPLAVEAYHGLVMVATQSGHGELDEILRRVEGAIEMCRREKRKKEVKEFRLLLAQVRVIEGRYAEALRIYEELVKEEPRDFRPYLCQGIIYTLMRRKDDAEKQFDKYRKLVPEGHPYARFFDRNLSAMKGFSPAE